MTERRFYEAVGAKGSDSGPYAFRVFHYDPSGNKEIVDHQSALIYRTEFEALDAAGVWLDENDMDAEMG